MILNEQLLLEFKLEMEELITDRESMIAHNQQKESVLLGQSTVYESGDFTGIAIQFKKLREKLIILGEK